MAPPSSAIPRFAAAERLDLIARTDGEDATAADRHRVGAGSRRIHRDHRGAGDHGVEHIVHPAHGATEPAGTPFGRRERSLPPERYLSPQGIGRNVSPPGPFGR